MTDVMNAIKGIRREIDSRTLFGESMTTALLILADALEEVRDRREAGLRLLAVDIELRSAFQETGPDDSETALLCGVEQVPHWMDEENCPRYCVGKRLFVQMAREEGAYLMDETESGHLAPHSILWNGTVSFPSYSEAIMALASALS